MKPLLCALCAGASECALEPQGADAARRRDRGSGGHDRWSPAIAILVGSASRPGSVCCSSPRLSVALGIVGAIDDIRPLPALPRLASPVRSAVWSCFPNAEIRVVSRAVPLVVEWAFLMLAGVWFVNLVNFMDGLDWITVAEMVPITAFIAALGWFGSCRRRFRARHRPPLCGALIGFALFQQARGEAFSRRCGVAAHRPSRRLASAATRRHRRACGRDPAAALLSGGRHHHAAAPPRPSREGVGGASQPFLPAGDRQRLFGDGGERACVRAQSRAGGAGGVDDRLADAVRAGRRAGSGCVLVGALLRRFATQAPEQVA